MRCQLEGCLHDDEPLEDMFTILHLYGQVFILHPDCAERVLEEYEKVMERHRKSHLN